jgi:arginase
MKFILPNPFNCSTYGMDDGLAYLDIINSKGANSNASEHFPSNQITQNIIVLDPVTVDLTKFQQEDSSNHIDAAVDMQQSVVDILNSNIKDFESSQILVIGGDHTISIGTGAYLSAKLDMSTVGLIWIDAHGDFNTPQTSSSQSLTGYPCAVNNGLGDERLLTSYKSNFITKTVQIGIRDIDELEAANLQLKEVLTFSNLEVEEQGLNTILDQALFHLSDCEYIWLSIDIDSLDPIYCDQGRTDVPVTGGLTPRELMYITDKVFNSGKLKVTEIVQINNTPNNSNLVYLANRLIELAFGLGSFRINKPRL